MLGLRTAGRSTRFLGSLLVLGVVIAAGPAVRAGDPPGPVANPAPAPDRPVPMRVRVELATPGAADERIDAASIYFRGERWTPKVGVDYEISDARPIRWVLVWIDDPRAALKRVRTRVPDPMPTTLTVRVPSRGDPRLAHFDIVVVDGKTRSPLPGATLAFNGLDPRPKALVADAAGRIRVPLPKPDPTENALEAGLRQWSEGLAALTAPRHFMGGVVRHEAHDVFADGTALAEWIRTGAYPMELLPVEGDFEERRFRLLDAEGRPAPGVPVIACFPIPTKGSGRWERSFDGPYRTDAEGFVTLWMPPMAALEAHPHGDPAVRWHLVRSAGTPAPPRELRMPAVVSVTIEIRGVPSEDKTVGWEFDILGAGRKPWDISFYLPIEDPGVAAMATKAGVVLAHGMPQPPGGELEAKDGRAHLELRLREGILRPLFIGGSVLEVTPKGGDPETIEFTLPK